jgi:hypothetical protein
MHGKAECESAVVRPANKQNLCDISTLWLLIKLQ